jgi:hypothetical protein
MKFVPQKSEKSVSGGGGSLASVIDAAEPSVAGISGFVAGEGVTSIPVRDTSHIANGPAKAKSDTAARIREQLAGICTLRSAAINAALNIKGSFGEGFEAYMGHILRTKPELGLGFLKPLMNMGMESAAVGPERAPILIIQSGGPVSVQSVERAA